MTSLPQNIAQNDLLRNLSSEEIENLISSARIKIKDFCKGELLFAGQEFLHYTACVISGSVSINHTGSEDGWSILSMMKSGDVFAFALTSGMTANQAAGRMEFRVEEDSTILFLLTPPLLKQNPEEMTRTDIILLQNITRVMAGKNIMLNHKLLLLSQNTLRKRIMMYLNTLSQSQNSDTVHMEYTREQLARYLCVNRSALSRELSLMSKEKLIECSGKKIKICRTAGNVNL